MANRRIVKKKKKELERAEALILEKEPAAAETIREEPEKKLTCHFVVQYQNLEVEQKEVMDKIWQELEQKGIQKETVTELAVYLKPEERKAYYVADGRENGFVEL